jgi:hypothetical protein
VRFGVLEAIELVLTQVLARLKASECRVSKLVNSDACPRPTTQGADVVGARLTIHRYSIGIARETCARVLLNLALSERTAAAVCAHTGIVAG